MLKIDVSSAYMNRDPMVIAAGRSLVNKVNKIGPKTDPCGRQFVSNMSDSTPLVTVYCILPLK